MEQYITEFCIARFKRQDKLGREHYTAGKNIKTTNSQLFLSIQRPEYKYRRQHGSSEITLSERVDKEVLLTSCKALGSRQKLVKTSCCWILIDNVFILMAEALQTAAGLRRRPMWHRYIDTHRE